MLSLHTDIPGSHGLTTSSGVSADQMHGLMDLLGVAQEEEQDERSKPPSQLGNGGAGGECGESHGKCGATSDSEIL